MSPGFIFSTLLEAVQLITKALNIATAGSQIFLCFALYSMIVFLSLLTNFAP
jgi:hypothetical protein